MQLAQKYLPKLSVSADYIGISATSETDPAARTRAFDLAKQFAADPAKIQASVQQAEPGRPAGPADGASPAPADSPTPA